MDGTLCRAADEPPPLPPPGRLPSPSLPPSLDPLPPPQVFYATIGASANVGLVLSTAPVLFLFSLIALAAHLGLLLAVGRLLGLSRRDLLLASNANIGGECSRLRACVCVCTGVLRATWRPVGLGTMSERTVGSITNYIVLGENYCMWWGHDLIVDRFVQGQGGLTRRAPRHPPFTPVQLRPCSDPSPARAPTMHGSLLVPSPTPQGRQRLREWPQPRAGRLPWCRPS